jgi:hypothetical protein
MMRTPDPRGPSAAGDIPDIAIAQVLALAKAANVEFELVDGRLAMRCTGLDGKLWSALRPYLEAIGFAAIERYFERTTREERERLMQAPPPSPGRIERSLRVW